MQADDVVRRTRPFGRQHAAGRGIKQRRSTAALKHPNRRSRRHHNFDQAEAVLEQGEATSSPRATSIDDHDWFSSKVRRDAGEEVRRCNYTNYCEGWHQFTQAGDCKLWDSNVSLMNLTQHTETEGGGCSRHVGGRKLPPTRITYTPATPHTSRQTQDRSRRKSPNQFARSPRPLSHSHRRDRGRGGTKRCRLQSAFSTTPYIAYAAA